MNKKLAVVAALVLGAAGLMLGQNVKAQDATDNSAMNSDAVMNSDSAMNSDSGAAVNADASAPAAQ